MPSPNGFFELNNLTTLPLDLRKKLNSLISFIESSSTLFSEEGDIVTYGWTKAHDTWAKEIFHNPNTKTPTAQQRVALQAIHEKYCLGDNMNTKIN